MSNYPHAADVCVAAGDAACANYNVTAPYRHIQANVRPTRLQKHPLGPPISALA